MSDPPGDGPLGFGGDRDPRDLRHRQDPDLDRLPDRPQRPRLGSSSIGLAVLVGFVVFVTAAVLLGDAGNGTGARGLDAGTTAPPFAAPLVDGPTRDEFDVNVAERAVEGVPAACDVRGPSVLNGCALWRDRPAALVLFASESDRCVRAVDRIDRIQSRFDGIGFAAVAIGGDRSRVRRLAERRGWTLPVAYDRDGTLGQLYGAAVCPQVTFVRRGGEVAGSALGDLTPGQLERRLEALAAGRTLPEA